MVFFSIQSCSARCKKENKHVGEHAAQPEASCTYSAILENKVYSCKSCKVGGEGYFCHPTATFYARWLWSDIWTLFIVSFSNVKENGRKNLVVPKASSSKEGSWVGLGVYIVY